MDAINEFFNYSVSLGESFKISVKGVIVILVLFIAISIFLKFIKRLLTRKLLHEDKLKFNSVFSFTQFFIYLVVVLISLQNMGAELTAILAASAALLVGIGLALQTFFQDIISGIFILVDQSVHVGDIIEIDGKIGRVVEINLRTTRAVTVSNKVLVIPNHKYLTSILFNWTENGILTRESIDVGVAYGSDVVLVKKILLQAAEEHPKVLKDPPPGVLFMDFGESSLDFRLVFSVDDSFTVNLPKSDIRFRINELFIQNKVTIPFPQRDVYLKQTN
ncbi:mechanosensitive ion channel family protein [Paucihalobacter sp.]|uniref:mechanosensitive ion channel family protein n=1 Tax=Paucihalobacter sp. TaxID=2850405 RepID=UPI002FE0DFE8